MSEAVRQERDPEEEWHQARLRRMQQAAEHDAWVRAFSEREALERREQEAATQQRWLNHVMKIDQQNEMIINLQQMIGELLRQSISQRR